MKILWNLVRNRSSLGIAFSGGADSLACAVLFNKFNPTLYHFNHNLGQIDDEIQGKVERLAEFLDLPLVIGRATDTYRKGSLEDWCRNQRYAWFSKLNTTLILGHNLSEATESYIMNCFRGCPEYLPIPITGQFGGTTVVRPLILESKAKILEFLDKNSLSDKIVEDSLNLDLTKRRNWVRLQLLPQIQEKTNVEKVVKKRYLDRISKTNASVA